MYCSKCGAEIVTGGKFCSECGAKAETVCPSCKTVLADTAKFCHACGTKVEIGCDKKYNADITVSEKRNRMIYVEGKGVYYIANQSQICFIESGQNRIKKLTNKAEDVFIDGLGYYNDELFYWYQHYKQDAKEYSELRAINIHTMEKRKIKKISGLDLLQISTNCVFVFRENKYIILNSDEQNIWEISVADCSVVKKELPVLKYDELPEDWKGFFNSYEQIRFNTFLAVNEYGYASVSGACQFTIRFKLDNPDEYVCMPMSCCTAQPFYGVIIDCGNKIYSCASECYPNHFNATKIVNNQVVSKVLFESEKWLYKTHSNSMRSWWRRGEQYIFGSIVMDMSKSKFLINRMNDSWENALDEVLDFIEDENGNVYLLKYNGDIYFIPNGVNVYEHDTEKYLIKYAM